MHTHIHVQTRTHTSVGLKLMGGMFCLCTVLPRFRLMFGREADGNRVLLHVFSMHFVFHILDRRSVGREVDGLLLAIMATLKAQVDGLGPL